ncbi:MAG: tetratricopeptide repeat protein [Candidatus Helarchaeota archaeon]
MSVNVNELYYKGKDAMDNKDYETAIEALEKALKLSDEKKIRKKLEKCYEKQAEIVNKLGDELYKKSKYEEALDYYKQSIELISKTDEEGKRKKFVKEFQATCEKIGKEINKKGDQAYKKKEYENALKLYEESLRYAKKSEKNSIIKESTKELMKTYEKVGEELAEEAKKYKDDIQKSVELYEDALIALERSGNESKLKKLKKKLEDFFEDVSEKINKQGDKAYKEKKYEEAIRLYADSIDLAKKSGKKKLISNFQAELDKTLEAYAKQVNEEGDREYKNKNWEAASNIYKKSVRLAKRSKKEKLVDNFTRELGKTHEKWAEEINEKGDHAYKNDDFARAVKLYSKSVELMKEAGNEKKAKKFQKERDKALKKLKKFS